METIKLKDQFLIKESETEPDYREALAFIEGYMNSCFRICGEFTEKDRKEMLAKLYYNYNIKPVSSDLRKLIGIK